MARKVYTLDTMMPAQQAPEILNEFNIIVGVTLNHPQILQYPPLNLKKIYLVYCKLIVSMFRFTRLAMSIMRR